MDSKRAYIVVGNQTLASARLQREVKARAADGPARFHFVVPAEKANAHSSWTNGEAHASASDRLVVALAEFTADGLDVDGEVADAHVVDAVRTATTRDHYDEIILSTLPPGLSRWIHMDLARRLERGVKLPVRHIIVPFDDVATRNA